jgi:hypothetical protein
MRDCGGSTIKTEGSPVVQNLEHPRLGTLRYDEDCGWDGWINTPRFAECRMPERKQRRTGIEGPTAELEDDPDDPDDPEDIDVNDCDDDVEADLQRMTGKLRLRIEEVRPGSLTAAQERTIAYFLDHEAKLLAKVLDLLYLDYRDYRQEALDLQREYGEAAVDEIPPRLKSSSQLREFVEFELIEVGGDVIDGSVTISLSLDSDFTGGMIIELLQDEILEWEGSEPECFPARVPNTFDLSHMLPDEGEVRSVEFKIYGRWSGIYHIDDRGVVVDRVHCWICNGEYWDPEGIEDVRIPNLQHLRSASLPEQVALPAMMMLGGCLGSLFLVLGFVLWGGLYWVSLVLSTLTLSAKLAFSRLRRFAHVGDYVRPAVVLGLSVAGILHSQRNGGGVNEGLLTAIGWGAWSLSALVLLLAVRRGVKGLMRFRSKTHVLSWAFALPPLFISMVLGTALWKTYQGDVSKLHLIWAVPATFLISILITFRLIKWQILNLHGGANSDVFNSEEDRIFLLDPRPKDRRSDNSHGEEDS